MKNTGVRSWLVGKMRPYAAGLVALALLLPMLGFVAAGPTQVGAQPLGVTNNTLAQYKLWIQQARATYPYPQSTDKMYRVMMCESSGNAGVVNPWGYTGLFQYARTTWGGRWNPYRYNSMYDAHSQIFATAKAWSIGMQSQWSCYYITAGR